MRLENHPILEFDRGEKVKFYYNGQEMEGYASETVAAALHAAGVRVLGPQSGASPAQRAVLCHWQLFLLFYDGGRRAQRPCLCHKGAGGDRRVEEQHGKGVVQHD